MADDGASLTSVEAWVRREAAEGGASPAAAIRCHLFEPATRPAAGVVLVLHGRDGNGCAAHLAPVTAAYRAQGWRVVAPDLPCSRATPDSGPAEEFTMQGHSEDAAAVLAWVQEQRQKDAELPLAIVGHSVGAYSAARLGAQTADLDHLLAVSPVVSGGALLAARRAMGPPAVDQLRRDAPRMLAEMEVHDAVPSLARITAPVAVITGALDGITPVAAARAYFAAAPGACFFAALCEQHHCPEGADYALALEAALRSLGVSRA
ncbi:MAG: alpha/beta fold hydrolase [Geminicoccaceae bacterium]|nr:alpha/beta fold hydrolase [Geminicoccaceae bacterium]